MSLHPCLSCGACCTFFRVSFHWSETLAESYGVPVGLTAVLSPHRNVMIGTDQVKPRCVALAGVVGQTATCAIYQNRPGCCREFMASFEDGAQNLKCDEVRASKGLKALERKDWMPLLAAKGRGTRDF